tara:strand:+ start:786 stop:1442 length:657 start_codon:yes stop_codon:yes gene_type:complete
MKFLFIHGVKYIMSGVKKQFFDRKEKYEGTLENGKLYINGKLTSEGKHDILSHKNYQSLHYMVDGVIYYSNGDIKIKGKRTTKASTKAKIKEYDGILYIRGKKFKGIFREYFDIESRSIVNIWVKGILYENGMKIYDGEFTWKKDNKYHGKGTLYSNRKILKEGEWENGKLKYGVVNHYLSNGTVLKYDANGNVINQDLIIRIQNLEEKLDLLLEQGN